MEKTNYAFEEKGKGFISSIFFLLILMSWGCDKNKQAYKASGIFEAKEIIVAAESSGKVEQLQVEEGMVLSAGQPVGMISCSQQALMASQADESLKSLNAKTLDAGANIKVLDQQIVLQQNQVRIAEDQLSTLVQEEARIQRLVKAEAAPSKQLDDIQNQKKILEKQVLSTKAQIDVINEQIKATRQNTASQNRAILSEKSPLSARVEQLKDLEEKCKIINPISGTVLNQYTYAYEVVNIGKALYKIANLDTLYLKAYITGNQLGEIKLHQSVQIYIQQGDNPSFNYPGQITWISDKAEFTPKSIMTVDERANLVYPVKIKVANDGQIKLGMFAEVNW
ncbi:MAG: HlyD family efflux transporter periplasmic adaptor subunit [Saprospiraceae bacterium]|nr:HlyD family efflux transporter periplasmic adaptor subunit [Saprospiraceae bacterium]